VDIANQTAFQSLYMPPLSGKPSSKPDLQPKTKNPRITAKEDKKNRIIEWLQSELENRSGYTEFRAGFHHVKHNPDIVKSWKFAVEFLEAYNKQVLIVRLLPALLKSYSICRLIFIFIGQSLCQGPKNSCQSCS
jgi:hypothetical protein